uniref:Uncharacterized protein n=1 Tax=Physcomitrium patens TaxID=3218 RepID=A0A2K1JHN8_PHYPA|nr:hypothetical protein PHYPA_018476 [Physcomitrium patens]
MYHHREGGGREGLDSPKRRKGRRTRARTGGNAESINQSEQGGCRRAGLAWPRIFIIIMQFSRIWSPSPIRSASIPEIPGNESGIRTRAGIEAPLPPLPPSHNGVVTVLKNSKQSTKPSSKEGRVQQQQQHCRILELDCNARVPASIFSNLHLIFLEFKLFILKKNIYK